MAHRTGFADMPLHGGAVPAWLSTRMARLGRLIVEAIVLEYGRDELLRRLAHPFWFQSFGAVMGMDWHSSGITTSVIGALKRGLAPVQRELGIYVCGGKGRRSRDTPQELLAMGHETGADAAALVRASRLVAKVDSAAVQDGFDLYLHGFFSTPDGRWCVVQQGMNPGLREARRYHWLSEDLPGFLESPHAAIEGVNVGAIVNLADARAGHSREAGLELARSGPDRTVSVLRRLWDDGSTARSLPLFPDLEESALPAAGATARPGPLHLRMPHHHDVRPSDVVLKRLHASLAAAADAGPRDYAELLLTPGVGARTVEALALVAEVVHGAPSRFSDPARFSMAHGGKDGHPFPVPLDVFDRTITVLKGAVTSAKLGSREELSALQRLDDQARMLERQLARTRNPPLLEEESNGRLSFYELVSRERESSARYGGRSV